MAPALLTQLQLPPIAGREAELQTLMRQAPPMW